MDLTDRYIDAVRFWLPRAKRDDIVAELSEDLRSQIEELEATRRRPLDTSEVATLLKQRGHPLLVANRYLPQQSLIGPVLFPAYTLVLKIAVLGYLVPWLLVWVGFMSFSPGYRATHSVWTTLLGGWGSFWLTAFVAIGAVTLVFAVLERVQVRPAFLDQWDPLTLRRVQDPARISRVNSIIEVAAYVIFAVWWLSGMWSQLVFDRAGVQVVLTPAWTMFFWALLAIALANIALSVANYLRPYWTRLRSTARLVIDCAGAVVVCSLFKAQILAEISAPGLTPARAGEIVTAINTNLSRSFPFAVIGCLLVIVLSDVGRFMRLTSRGWRLIHRAA